MQKLIKNTDKKLKNFKTNKDYDNFVDYLKFLSKCESVEDLERHKRIINSEQEIIGISMKNIRKIAQEISRNCMFDYLSMMEMRLKGNCFYEETLIEGLVIAKIKDLDLQIKKLRCWVEKIDNWATCDSVVTSLKILKKSKYKQNYFDVFKTMVLSEREFIARFGIVVLLVLYLDIDNIDEIFNIIKSINNNAYYVKMAIAWLISSAFLINETKTYDLLNERVLDRFIQNKAISKCRESFRISKENKEKLKLLKM